MWVMGLSPHVASTCSPWAIMDPNLGISNCAICSLVWTWCSPHRSQKPQNKTRTGHQCSSWVKQGRKCRKWCRYRWTVMSKFHVKRPCFFSVQLLHHFLLRLRSIRSDANDAHAYKVTGSRYIFLVLSSNVSQCYFGVFFPSDKNQFFFRC